MRKRHNASALTDKKKIDVPTPFDGGTKNNSDSEASWKRAFYFCLAARIVNSLVVQTYFNPDEHWQSLEVAHRLVFGYGHLTWEWKRGIRSYLHPLLFAVLYKFLAFLHLDTPWFMVKAPRLLQSIFAAICDLYLFKLSDIIFGKQVAKWTLFSHLTNWFVFFCCTRTLSNSLETALTVVSLYYWPCIRGSCGKFPSNSRRWALAIAAFACAVRPTSAIIWLYVGLIELLTSSDRLKFVFLEAAPIGAVVLAITSLLDRIIYGSWIIVPFNFLKFNFLSSGGDYYGTHPWHWYLIQGFPVMLFTFLPFSIAGIIYSKQWKLSGLIGWVIGIYSVLGHKEFRFVLPVLPIALMFSGYSLTVLEMPDLSMGVKNRASSSHTKWPSKLRLAVVFLVATNIPMALYMSLVHQRGSEDVMHYLAMEATKGEVKSVLFLTPCHATPYYSTLHQNLPMRFLDCTPSEERGTLDESDRFMLDPHGFASAFAKNWSLPSHIVLFDSEEKKLKDFLLSHSFREVKRFFHAHFKAYQVELEALALKLEEENEQLQREKAERTKQRFKQLI
ncbi:mannosyltransferase APTG1 isoform X2 [Amaranthus tricolor]|uniref:mannosyltransferase APTG1 isoform X2 n=1 Tax=Amaranthus tricolor TaxID=29722 RepID=UPI002587CFBD|nr:mannosyltransferase APTG1 isoform X2 [Amaranthus tricolor]